MALALTGPRLKDQADYQRSLQDALAEFQSLLSVDEKRTLTTIHAIHNSGTVLEFVADLDFKNKLRGGHGVAQRLHGVLESVLAFSGVVDTFVSSNPETAALVWGSVKMALQIVINYTSYFEKLSEVFMRIRKLCPRLSDYRALFPDSIRLQRALCEFHAAIIRFCTQALRGIKRSKMSHLLKALQSFEVEFKPHLDKLKELSEDVKAEVFLAKAQCDLRAQEIEKKENEIASRHRSQLARTFSRTGRELEELRKLQKEQRLRDSRLEAERLLNELSPLDLRAFHEACRKQHPGTTIWMQTNQGFSEWFNGTNASPVWCSGKIGSGKTIMSSSVINYVLREKHNHDRMAFFFIQYDDNDFIKADTVLRSILRQCIDDAILTGDEKTRLREMHNGRPLSTQDWIGLIQQRTRTSRQFYLIVDGLDECKSTERYTVIDALSALVKQSPNLRLFLASRPSVRLDLERKFPSLRQISMVSEGQAEDIRVYIKAVIELRLSTAELIIQDPALLEDVVQTLSSHADGMFIWVFFLMNEICAANTDDEIRQFLKDLPPDLTTTFIRALSRILSRQKKEALMQRVFPWVAAAKRPLSLSELQDILSVQVGDQYTESSKRIRDFGPIEQWSENLLQVSEDDKVYVHFAHSTVHDFFLNTALPSHLLRFHVDLPVTEHLCGELCVTYLHLNDFKTTLSRRPQPLPAMDPTLIAQTALGAGSRTLQVISRLVKRHGTSASDFDVVGKLATYSRGPDTDDVRQHHPFLAYASTYWVHHSKEFAEGKSHTWPQWYVLIMEEHELAKRPWKGTIYPNARHAMMLWAQANRHLAILGLLATLEVPLSLDQILTPFALSGDLEAIATVLGPRKILGAAVKDILLAACKGGHLHIFEYVSNLNMSDMAFLLHGSELLKAASQELHVDMTRYLLDLGATINCRQAENPHDETLLHQFAADGSLSAMMCLFDAGLDFHEDVPMFLALIDGNSAPLETPSSGFGGLTTVVGVAARAGHSDVVEYLCRHFASNCPLTHNCLRLSAKDALIRAPIMEHIGIMEYILSTDVLQHVGLPALEAMAPLSLMFKKNPKAVESLADPDRFVNTSDRMGNTVLTEAIERNHPGIIRHLVYGRIDREIYDVYGRKALIVAAEAGLVDVVKTLLSSGARLNATDGHQEVDVSPTASLTTSTGRAIWTSARGHNTEPVHGATALHAAAKNGHAGVVALLVASFADMNATDRHGKTPLIVAVEHGEHEVVECLVKAGAAVDVAYGRGRRALVVATENGDAITVRHLLNIGNADTSLTAHWSTTALMIAARSGFTEIAQMLLDAGAVTDLKDSFDQTPLMMASRAGHLDVVRCLLRARANVSMEADSFRAIDLATKNGHFEIVKELER